MGEVETFLALTPESLPSRLALLPALTQKLGSNPTNWRVREVGDGFDN